MTTKIGIPMMVFPRTAGEISAGVTPVNYGYKPGDVRRFGAVGDGVTNDTAALQATWSAIVGAGGGTLTFEADKVYSIGSPPSILFDCTNLRGVVVEGNGSKLLYGNLATTCTIFFVSGTDGLLIENLAADSSTTGQLSSTSKGYRFIYGTNSINIFADNFDVRRALTAVTFYGNFPTISAGPVRNGVFTNAYVEETYYGFNFQAGGDNMFIRARTINCGRAYFPWNVRDHDVDLYSEHGGPFDDVLLKVYCDSRHGYNKLENIKLVYSTSGRHSSAQTHGSLQALIAVDMQIFDAGFPTGGQMNNIDLTIVVSDVPSTAAIKPQRVFVMRRQDAAGAPDTTSRSHVFQNWNISCRVASWQNGLADAVELFNTSGGYVWTGDYAANFHLRNMQGAGLATQTFLRINGVPFNGAGRMLTLENVTTDMDINFDNYPSSGHVQMIGVYADNLNRSLYGRHLILNAATPVGVTGELALGTTVGTTVGAAGGASALPATPLGYITANISGTNVKIPYYNA